MTFFRHFSCLAALALAGLAPAHSHVTLEHQTAHAGSHYKANFKIGHGCGTSPTRQVVVDIPAGVRGAKPSPKPGWDLAIERAPLAQPYQDHGRTVSEEVVRIRWTARTPSDMLPNEHYDEFALLARLPQRDGPLYWPVSQVCAEGRLDWHQVPQPGQRLQQLRHPAALLDLLPAPSGAHVH